MQKRKFPNFKQQICNYFAFGFAFLAVPHEAMAKKTNQAVYQEPFDLAAGGASLTRASQEGVMFANPALMPWGGKIFRAIGAQFSLISSKESVEMVRGLTSNSSSGDDESSTITEAFTTPIHFGVTSTLYIVTNNLGFAAFGRFEPDIAGEEFNDTGVPEIRARAEVYGGAVTSAALRLTSWLSFGVTAKYLYVSEPDISVSLADQDQVKELQSNPQALKEEAELNKGMGFDAGVLLFSQGNTFDTRLALKADDIGGTTFDRAQEPFKQTLSAGLGFTLHNSIDSIHIAADYRDILGAYGESLYMRTYAGAKLLLRNHLGLAAGVYQGYYPSFGVRLDLFLIKAGLTYYTRELGEYIGDDKRNLYVAYFSIGY